MRQVKAMVKMKWRSPIYQILIYYKLMGNYYKHIKSQARISYQINQYTFLVYQLMRLISVKLI